MKTIKCDIEINGVIVNQNAYDIQFIWLRN